jgi:1-acyl-sn-glycerol-3-phosphate acyltransferase
MVRSQAHALARGLALALWLAGGVVTVALCYPVISRRVKLALKQRWSQGLLAILGIALEVRSAPAPGTLIVANHLSWIDIYVINAVRPSAFVAKREVRQWPVIGWLCARTDTLFIRRQSAKDAQAVNRALRFRLAAGASVALFPEGTSTEGDRVLRFSAALFQSAIDAQVPVQPAAIAYRQHGVRSTAPCYAGETTMWESIRETLSAESLRVSIDWLPPIDPAGMDRRALADATEAAIRERVLRHEARPLRVPELLLGVEASA